MSPPLISVRQVGMTYGSGAASVRALDDVSLDIDRGEIVLIMGPSGSGKTTLLQVLGALVRPTAGSVHIAGDAIDVLSPRDLGRLRLDFFGFVFQAHNLIPTLRAWENVALAFDLKGIRGRTAEWRSRELLDLVGVGHRANAFPGEMSGGQRQRVAIARACAMDPAVILADEPTASLDSASGWQVIQLLRELAAKQDCAVVIVTHDNRLIAPGDRVVAIEDGRLAPVPPPTFARSWH